MNHNSKTTVETDIIDLLATVQYSAEETLDPAISPNATGYKTINLNTLDE